MAKNQVQFQRGISLPEVLKHYGTEEQCRAALFQWRWPKGFVCPECDHTGYCEIAGRGLYQCHHCHHQTSLISGTIFEYTKLPLATWFLGMYFLTQPKNGVSALELKRQLGIGYNAAWRMKHKLLQVMKERDDSHPCWDISSSMTPSGVVNAGAESADGAHRAKRLSSPQYKPTKRVIRSPCALPR